MNPLLGFVKVHAGSVVEPVFIWPYPPSKSCAELLYSDMVALLDTGTTVHITPDAYNHVRALVRTTKGSRLVPFGKPPVIAPGKHYLSPSHDHKLGADLIGVCVISWVYSRLLKNRTPAVYDADSNLAYSLTLKKRFKKLRLHDLAGLARILKQPHLDELNDCLLKFLKQIAPVAAAVQQRRRHPPDDQGHVVICE